MIAGQKFWRPPRIFTALTITPTFFFVVRSLSAIVFRNRIEHKTATLLICQDPAFAAHAFGHQNSHHTRRPNHAGGMKLHELHVDQICTCVISERVTVAGVLPTVAGNFVRPPNSASGQHHRFGAETLDSSTFASAAAIPPSAITVCALPNKDLHTSPTRTPATEASIAARSPAPPAPITKTSCSKVS